MLGVLKKDLDPSNFAKNEVAWATFFVQWNNRSCPQHLCVATTLQTNHTECLGIVTKWSTSKIDLGPLRFLGISKAWADSSETEAETGSWGSSLGRVCPHWEHLCPTLNWSGSSRHPGGTSADLYSHWPGAISTVPDAGVTLLGKKKH